ncbi:MAG: glycosyltransferase family 4 protein [Bacteroidales bacterium]|nr:glycosyltransferase family 4 protein [Bacteroidales bacterium]
MKVAVNARLLLKGRLEGIGRVAYETLRRMVTAHPEVEFYFLFDRKPDPMFVFAENVKPVVLHPQARHPFLYIIYFEISVARALRKIKPDVYYSPDGYACLHTDVPTIVHFHDLNFEHFPKDMPAIDLWHYRRYFPKFAKKASRIIAVSEFTKQDTCQCYHINPDKIDVAYNGVNEIFKPLTESEIAAVRQKYANGNPYFMFVGSLHPRKNLARLFLAFDDFKSHNHNDVKLLIVGEKRWWTSTIQEAYDSMEFQSDVIFTGRLGVEDLSLVTGAALASVYVSYFEGFGIPILEAFRCKVPVITSNVTAMPEVAGDAALMVDPFDVKSISLAMSDVLVSEKRSEAIEKGWQRMRLFSWNTAAETIWKSINSIC